MISGHIQLGLRGWVTVFLFALAGCVARQGVHEKTRLAPGVKLPLLEPATLGRSVAMLQRLEGNAMGKPFSLKIQWELDARAMVGVGLDPFGGSAFALSWSEGRLDWRDSPLFRSPLQPRRLLADLQWIYWPREILADHFREKGVRLEWRAATRERVFLKGEEVLLRIVYQGQDSWPDSAAIQNLRLGYAYTIHILDLQPLE